MREEFQRTAEQYGARNAALVRLLMMEVDMSIKLNAELNNMKPQPIMRAFFETVARVHGRINGIIEEANKVHQKN